MNNFYLNFSDSKTLKVIANEINNQIISKISSDVFNIEFRIKSEKDFYNNDTRVIIWDSNKSEYVESIDILLYVNIKRHENSERYLLSSCYKDIIESIFKLDIKEPLSFYKNFIYYSKLNNHKISTVRIEFQIIEIEEINDSIYQKELNTIWKERSLKSRNNLLHEIEYGHNNWKDLRNSILIMMSWNANNNIFKDYIFFSQLCHAIKAGRLSILSPHEIKYDLEDIFNTDERPNLYVIKYLTNLIYNYVAHGYKPNGGKITIDMSSTFSVDFNRSYNPRYIHYIQDQIHEDRSQHIDELIRIDSIMDNIVSLIKSAESANCEDLSNQTTNSNEEERKLKDKKAFDKISSIIDNNHKLN